MLVHRLASGEGREVEVDYCRRVVVAAAAAAAVGRKNVD